MQINIDKKSGIFVAIIAALLVVIAAISFSSGRGEHSGMHDMGIHEGALHMVLMIQDSKDSNLLTLRDNIMKTQSAEIEWMKKILG